MAIDRLAALRARVAGTTTVTPVVEVQVEPVTPSKPVGELSPLEKLKAKTLATKQNVPSTGLNKLISNTSEVAVQAQAVLDKESISPDFLALPDEVNNIIGFDAEAFIRNLEAMSARITEDEPDIAAFLEHISTDMRNFEELTYLMTPDQIGIIVRGGLKASSTEIKVAKARKTAAKGKTITAAQMANAKVSMFSLPT